MERQADQLQADGEQFPVMSTAICCAIHQVFQLDGSGKELEDRNQEHASQIDSLVSREISTSWNSDACDPGCSGLKSGWRIWRISLEHSWWEPK